MNLFWKKFLGKLKKTSKFEKEQNALQEQYIRYNEIEKSLELSQYKELFEIVKSAEFKEKKRILLNRKYKDTQEYRESKKFKKLQSDKALCKYFESLKDDDLQEFLVFRETKEYELLGKNQEVKKSAKLTKFKKIEKSKLYKNYTRFNNSYIVKDFLKIQEHVSTPEFIAENKFWADKNRWFTTPEYETEQKYIRLAKNPDIIFHESIHPEIFKNINDLTVTFIDEFKGNTLVAANWEFGFSYPSYKLMSNHSFANELQANNNGKNTNANNGFLEIRTEKETVTAPAWDKEKGFINKQFDYTSDVLHAKTFRQKTGIFSAKIRCFGNIHHAFWLGCEEKLPHINIFHYNGKNITIGNANPNAFDGISITGINPSKFYVYSLEWTEKELIWYINNMEVYRTKNNLPQTELFPIFNSFISEKQKGRTGSMQIDWIRVYRRK